MTTEPVNEVAAQHSSEPHRPGLGGRLNWLRAGVLGANDGVVSVAGIVVGVAAATSERAAIFTAGAAGLTAGAISMALGEYVSVSSQRDTEHSLLDKERQELRELPEEELDELTEIYRAKGLSERTARQVAVELTRHDAFAAHAEAELGISPEDLANPWQAAASSAASFLAGAVLPLVAILLPPPMWRVPITVAAVCLALALTGWVSATIGKADRVRAVVRITLGGLIAMAATYAIGALAGHAVG